MFKFRDLTILEISEDKLLVIACDSAGGIGNKEMDMVQVPPETVGLYTSQGPLMEILAVGAKPLCVIDNLGVEMDDTGQRLLKGVRQALGPLGEDILITGSTEENIPVVQTFIGITILGIMDKSRFLMKRPKAGDILLVVGIPLVGQEIVNYIGETFNSRIVLNLLEKPYISDILPVGSKGILHETGVLASSHGLDFQLEENIPIDLKKSAVPSSCGIIAMDKDYYEELRQEISLPLIPLGTLL